MARALSTVDRVSARLQGASLRGVMALPRPVLRALVGRPVIRDGQQLDLEVQVLLRLMDLVPTPELRELTPERGRRQVARDILSVEGRRPDPVLTSPVEIPGEGGPVAARLYAPSDLAPGSGLLVYYHGGGFVVGDLDTHENPCRLLALAAGVRVLSVDYRLAPEHRFPAAAEDAWSAFAFAADSAAELGAHPGCLAVAGDSAGGNLAAGVAQRAAREGGPAPVLQLLFYPWLDLSAKRASYRLFGEGFYLTEADLDWYRAHYLAAPEDARDPRCSPLLAADVAAVAPAYVATAGFDPLRDEGEEYADRLRGAGVAVALHRHAGLIHGFANAIGAGRRGREAVLAGAGALRMALARS